MKRTLAALLLTLCAITLSTAVSGAIEPQEQTTANLIAHWKMDEGSGTLIADSSGNGYHGLASGGTWSTDRPAVAGLGSYSYAFNGSTYIDTAAFDINDDFSIAVWVKPSDREAEAILGKHTDAGANLLLYGIYDGDYILNIRNDVKRTYPVPRDEWQHLLLVGRAEGGKTAVTIYRNGIPLWTFHHDQVIGDVSSGKPWTIGRDWDPAGANDYFNGLMADLRIYDGALSDAEIAAMTEGFAETCPVPSGIHPRLHMALTAGCEIIEVSAGVREVLQTDVNDGVIIRGAGREETVLELWMDSSRFLTLKRHATISDLTFRGRNGSGAQQQVSGGALVIAEGVRVTLDNVAFEDNFASFDGGAIANEGELTVLNSRFIDNKGGGFDADNPYRGGAIYSNNYLLVKNSYFEGNFMFANFRGGGRSGGAIGSIGTLRVEDSTFHDNNASFGGAILASGQTDIVNTTFTANQGQYGTALSVAGRLDLIDSVVENNEAYPVNDAKGAISVAGTIHIVDTRISGNSAITGGALHNLSGAYNNAGSTTITRGVITGNTADESAGAIYNQGNLFVVDSTISGNEAVNYAGAILNQHSSVMEIEGTTISGNKLTDSVWAYAASAIHNEGALTATNSTISGNYTVASTAEPSAIFQQYDDSSLALIHTTIAGNEAQTPGRGFGLHIIGGNVSVLNTLTAGNGRANCLMSPQAPYAGSVNLADDESCDQFVYAADLDLGPLADNGGPTETQAIGKDSAARDAGNAAWCEDEDQRGVARDDGRCDVGAYEFVSASGNDDNTVHLPMILGN